MTSSLGSKSTVATLSALSFAAVAALAFAGGCSLKAVDTGSGNDEDSAAAEQSVDSAATENDVEVLAQSFVGVGVKGGLGPASAGALGAGSLSPQTVGPLGADGGLSGSGYSPATCITSTEDTPTRTITYTLDRCTGPRGLATVTGTVKVVYAIKAYNSLSLTFASTGLKVNRSTVDWNATADITARDDERTMIWSGTVSGTTGRGRAISRQNDKTITWNLADRCVSIAGTSTGNISGKRLETTFTGYQRCERACPGAGSTITIKNLDTGRELRIEYSGSAEATLTSAAGKSVTVPLACGT